MTLIDDVELEFEIDRASLEQTVSDRLAHALNDYRNRVAEFRTSPTGAGMARNVVRNSDTARWVTDR